MAKLQIMAMPLDLYRQDNECYNLKFKYNYEFLTQHEIRKLTIEWEFALLACPHFYRIIHYVAFSIIYMNLCQFRVRVRVYFCVILFDVQFL